MKNTKKKKAVKAIKFAEGTEYNSLFPVLLGIGDKYMFQYIVDQCKDDIYDLSRDIEDNIAYYNYETNSYASQKKEAKAANKILINKKKEYEKELKKLELSLQKVLSLKENLWKF